MKRRQKPHRYHHPAGSGASTPPSGAQGNAVEEWRDWSDHQYLPGYYVGGRVPGWYLRRWTKPFTLFQLIPALMLVAAVLLGIATTRPNGFPRWFGLILLLGIAGLGLLLCARRWPHRRSPKPRWFGRQRDDPPVVGLMAEHLRNRRPPIS